MVIGLGVVLALVAVRLDDRRITWVAIGVLGLAFALRFAGPRPGADRSHAHDSGDAAQHDNTA